MVSLQLFLFSDIRLVSFSFHWSVYYCDRLDNRILPAMGHLQLGCIRQKDLNNYKKMLRDNYRVEKSGKPLSESSIRKDGAVISALLSYAVSESYLDINPIIYAGKTSK